MYHSIITEIFIIFYRQRFGLFSQPVSNAIGDNNGFQQKKRVLDEDGKVITAPRNFYTTRTKKGQVNGSRHDRVLFSKPGFNALGDPFIQAGLNSLGRTYVKDGHLKAGHEKAFVPAKLKTEKVPSAPYKYMEQKEGGKKNFRDEDGAVVTGPKQMLTSNLKRGKVGKGTTFGGPIPHVKDEYDTGKEVAKKEREYHESKI